MIRTPRYEKIVAYRSRVSYHYIYGFCRVECASTPYADNAVNLLISAKISAFIYHYILLLPV